MAWQTATEQPHRDTADAEVNGATDESLKREPRFKLLKQSNL